MSEKLPVENLAEVDLHASVPIWPGIALSKVTRGKAYERMLAMGRDSVCVTELTMDDRRVCVEWDGGAYYIPVGNVKGYRLQQTP